VGSAVFSTGRSKRDEPAFDFDDSDDNSRPGTFFGNAINHQQTFTTTTPPRLYPNIRGPAVNNLRPNSNRKAFADEKVSENADEFDEYTEDEVYEAAGRRSVGGANHSSTFNGKSSSRHVGNDVGQRLVEEERASDVTQQRSKQSRKHRASARWLRTERRSEVSSGSSPIAITIDAGGTSATVIVKPSRHRRRSLSPANEKYVDDAQYDGSPRLRVGNYSRSSSEKRLNGDDCFAAGITHRL
jgi:hypothetical protein